MHRRWCRNVYRIGGGLPLRGYGNRFECLATGGDRLGQGAGREKDMSTMQRVIWAVLALIWVHLFLYVVFADRGLVGVRQATIQYEAMQSENRDWVQRNLMLERQIDRLRHDPVFIEQTARSELGMVRPTELLFQFTDGLEAAPATRNARNP